MLQILKTVFVPILTYSHESWVVTKQMRSLEQNTLINMEEILSKKNEETFLHSIMLCQFSPNC